MHLLGLFLQLQVIFLTTCTNANTTVSENNQTTSEGPVTTASESPETSTAVQRKATTENWRENNCDDKYSYMPPFLEVIYCNITTRNSYRENIKEFNLLTISDQWLLGDAFSLQMYCKPHLDEVGGCLIRRDFSIGVKCKEIIVHEKYRQGKHYNIAAVLADKPLKSFQGGPVPWPQKRGFADKCAKFLVYSPSYDCTTLQVVSIKNCSKTFGEYLGSQGFTCAYFNGSIEATRKKKERNAFDQGVAVCNNIAAGFLSYDRANWDHDCIFLITKLEDYYTFIHETTGVEVPFESLPPRDFPKKEGTEEPEEELEDEEAKDAAYETTTKKYRDLRKQDVGHSQKSHASTRVPKPCLLIAFLMFLLIHVFAQ